MVQDSRSASYPGAAIASSYDFGSIDFFSSLGTDMIFFKVSKNSEEGEPRSPAPPKPEAHWHSAKGHWQSHNASQPDSPA